MIFGRRLFRRRGMGLESILYEVTSRCNLRCGHCYNVWKDEGGYPTNELDTRRAKALIGRAIRQSGCRFFTFTGGEPTLRDDLEELVWYAAKRCKGVTLITNGTLLTERRIRSLLVAGVNLFELPLNGPEKKLHNQMAGGADCFDAVVRATAEVRYQGGEIAFVFVGTSSNIETWEETLKLGIALGARSFLFNRYNAGGEYHGEPERLMPTVDQVQRGLEVAQHYAKEYGVGISASIAIPPCLIDTRVYPDVGFGYCAAGTERAYYTVDPVGNVRPCNHTPTVLGNLFEQTLREMASSEPLRAFVDARPSFCSGCKMELECQGGCKAAAQVCYGSLSTCEPFLALNQDKVCKRV